MPSTAAPRRTPPRALAVVAALALGACGPVAPTAAPTTSPTAAPATPAATVPDGSARPAAAVYADIRTAVEEIRALRPTKAVEPVTLDEAQLRTNLTAEFDATNTPAELRLQEDLLITLGLLPRGANLRDVMLDFQSGQVLGYYSPEKDQLFVVSRSGTLGPAEEMTYAHEFTHQLQDQHFDLGKLGLDRSDHSDLQVARLALLEGDATSVQLEWMIQNLTPEEIGELLAVSLDPRSVEALNRAPAFVRETSIFAYEKGLAFVTAVIASGGYDAVNAAYPDPPSSTEQIIDPAKYIDREEPVAVTIPAGVAAALGPGWTAPGQDTLGQLILDIWLREAKVPRADAATATSGWGGDRAVVLRGPDGAVGVGLVTAWDTPADAAEFAAAATTALQSIDPGGLVASDGLLRVIVALGDGAPEIVEALGG